MGWDLKLWAFGPKEVAMTLRPSEAALEKFVPFYRDEKRALGYIKDFFAIPCAIPAAVYIEASITGLWRIGYNIISPDPKEIYHELFGNSLYHDIKASAERTKVVAPRGESLITKGLFLVADVADVTLWYMFVFGSVVDGLHDFTSQIKRQGPCQTPHSPRFFSGQGYINAIGDDGNYYGDLFAGSRGDGTPVAGPAAFRIKQGQSGFAAGSCAFRAFGAGFPVPSTTAVICAQTGMIFNAGHSDPQAEGKQKIGHTWTRQKNMTSAILDYEVMSRYTGGVSLPLHEAFRDGDHWYGYSLDPSISI